MLKTSSDPRRRRRRGATWRRASGCLSPLLLQLALPLCHPLRRAHPSHGLVRVPARRQAGAPWSIAKSLAFVRRTPCVRREHSRG